jgi:hypothetical protein
MKSRAHIFTSWVHIMYNNKTTRVWFLREQKHTSDVVEGVSRPKTITSVLLAAPGF